MSINTQYEYELLAHDQCIGQYIKLPEFPELDIKYLGYRNNLCEGIYSNNNCVWVGILEISLLINGTVITINNQDNKWSKIHKINVNGYSYYFQGLKNIIENQSRDQTYLEFGMIKIPNDWNGSIQIKQSNN
jgi:hypothetical protein